MKRLPAYIIALVLIVATSALVFLALNSRNKIDKKSSASETAVKVQPEPMGKACKILTLPLAKQLLGNSVKGGPSPAGPSSKDISVTGCKYTQETGNSLPISARKSVSLVARVPMTEDGISGNVKQFMALKPAGAQDVPGYGDSAYWDVSEGQLNVLKGNNWYILSNGPPSPAGRNLDDAEQFAGLIAAQL